jgi:hypothetical protein
LSTSPPDPHRHELRALLLFLVLALGLGGLTWVVPGLEDLQPWRTGEPIPLVHLIDANHLVSVDDYGELSTREVSEAPQASEPESPNEEVQRGHQQPGFAEAPPNPGPPPPEDRPPASATAIDGDEEHQALAHFFTALAALDGDDPESIVRVMHWGDSTIAADGITGQVRRRLQERFGDGGPGFLSVEVDPRWGLRPGIVRSHKGEWSTQTITFAGAAEDRYGLAGTVSTAAEAASVLIGGLRIDGVRQPLARFDLHYQARPEAGSFEVLPSAGKRKEVSAASETVQDRFVSVSGGGGSRTARISTLGDGPVTMYGVSLETNGPGITWECLGVAGSSIASMLKRQGRKHLAGQIRRRGPELLVYQTGGNELTYPLLLKGEGEGYQQAYQRVLRMLRAGAPEASCLVIGPLDQAMRERGKIISKPPLDRMIAVQRRAAREEGCAFWDSRAAMGGEGGFARWLQHSPPYAWTDLMHLSMPGLDLIGDTLADALLHAYESWRIEQGLGPSPRPEEAAGDDDDSALLIPTLDASPERLVPQQNGPPAIDIHAD